MIERAPAFGVEVEIKGVNFTDVMKRMRSLIDGEIETIRRGLTQSPNIEHRTSRTD